MNKITLLICSLLFCVNCLAQFNSTKNFSYNKIQGEFSPLLALDIYSPIQETKMPVVIFVHGGGWVTGDKDRNSHINKRNFFLENGFVFVSVNYRLAPDSFYPVYPQDVADAVSFVLNWIGKFNGDNKNVFLMGHSAGAHLAALVATDGRYLNQHNYTTNDLKGVILLDGAGYNIPAVVDFQTQQNNTSAVNMYQTAFGTDLTIWQDASPVNHVSQAAPPFQLFYVDTRQVSTLMSSDFHAEILSKGVESELIAVSNSSHAQINNDFGTHGDVVSELALAFILSKMTIGTL